MNFFQKLKYLLTSKKDNNETETQNTAQDTKDLPKDQQEIDPLLNPQVALNTSETTNKIDTGGMARPNTERPNRRPLAIAIGIAVIAVSSLFYFDNNSQSVSPEEEAALKGDNSDAARDARLKHLQDGVIEKPAEAPISEGNDGIVEASEPSAPSAPPLHIVPGQASLAPPPPPDGDIRDEQLREQIAQQKMQMLQAATQSSSAISLATPPDTQQRQNTPNASSVNADMPTFDPEEKPALSDKEREKRWNLETKKLALQTPYTIRSGFVIPAILNVGLNSDQPGQTQALVSQNVYDSATGKYLLIPQGSKLIGSYQSAPAYGSKRVAVLWERLIFPDGASMDIGGMQGADFSGINGLKDQVNNHWGRLFTAAIFSSILEAPSAMGSVLSMSGTGSNGMMSNLQSGGGMAAQQVFSQTGSSLAMPFQRDITASPTLIIRPGFILNVIVNKDLQFENFYKN
ncbi:hypothetical protein FAI40_08330 [Acetobacteraceae bacterium]|nr:hypothetical protein FAI40_08330 [Acetobacteraceae bacterium]